MGVCEEFGSLNDMRLDSGVCLHICTDASTAAANTHTRCRDRMELNHPSLNEQCCYSISWYSVYTNQIHLKSCNTFTKKKKKNRLTVFSDAPALWSHGLSECRYIWEEKYIFLNIFLAFAAHLEIIETKMNIY